jgi:hypothetical protein
MPLAPSRNPCSSSGWYMEVLCNSKTTVPALVKATTEAG